MNLGPTELIILALLVAFFWVTITALISSARRKEWAWFVGILVAWLVGFGWLVALSHVVRTRALRSVPGAGS